MRDISHDVDISKSNTPLHIKFALVCLDKAAFPKWLGFLCFVLSHLQFIALIVKSAYLALADNTPSSSPAIKLFIKLFVIGDWISPTNTAPIVVGVAICTIYTIKVLSLMVYLHFSLFMKRKIPDLVQRYWGVLHSLHPLVLFFWIHTFCMKIVLYPPQAEGTQGIRILAYINMVINGLLALFFSIISVTFKNKNVLASKMNLLETKTVIFKILIPALWKATKDSQGIQIFVLILTFLSSTLHDWIFVKYLPYYRINMLILSSIFQGVQTSLALTGCIVKFVEAGGAYVGIFAFQMVSVLIMPLMIKAYYSEVWRILLYIFGCEVKNEKNVYYLVHKRFILLYFLRLRKAIHGGIKTFSFADIMYQARLAEIVKNSGELLSFEKLDKNKKLLIRSLKVICLEVLKLRPRALLAQINLAYSYSKFEDLYLVSNNLLEDALSKRPWYHAQISLNMIRLELQKKLKLEFSEKAGEGLNVHSYITNHELHEELKIKVRKQAEMQLNFWTEFTLNKPKMMNLVNIAVAVNDQKKIIRRLWNSLAKIRPSSFLPPLIVYGMYSSLINNDSVEGEKYLEQSQEDTKKMNRLLKADELNNQTIFSEKSVQITMAGVKSKLGKIMDCSANIANFYGWNGSDMKGRSVSSLMPPFYRQRHDGFLMNHFNTGEAKIINTTIMVPVKRANGYIHPSWIHVKVNPLMENGMSYVALLRPCKSSQRMILVKKDGKIDDMSFEFARDMNLMTRKEDHYEREISEICPEFKQINEAFNMIADGKIENNDDPKESRHDTEMKTEGILPVSNRSAKNTERPLLSGRGRKIHFDTGVDDDIPRETTVERFTSPQIENNKAQSIYENFMKGSNLTFYPRNEQRESLEPITYNVKINNSIHGKDMIKIVLLERIDDNMEQLTDEEDVVSSFQRITNEFPVKDPPLSPKTLRTGYDTEGAELLSLATSPKEKRNFRPFESLHDESNMSIIDEVQNNDLPIRTAISRNIIKEKKSSLASPRRRRNQTLHTEGQSALFTEQNDVRRRKSQLLVPKEQNQQKLKQGLMNIVANVAKIENSVASSYVSKGKKAEQLVVRALKSEPKKKSASIFTYFFLLFLALMIVILIVQNINLRVGIRDVQSQVPVISAGFLRQYNMAYTALEILQFKVFFEGKFLIGTWESDYALLAGYLVYYLVRMTDQNSQFYELLNKLDVDIQGKFYKKSVGLYESEVDGGNKTLVGMFSTFEAFQIMIEKGFSVLYKKIPDQWEEGIDISNNRFIMDNILNNLWIESQSQNVQLAEDLNDSTNSTTVKMAVTTGVALVSCAIFMLISIRFLWVIASEARIFMTMIFRIKPHECAAIKTILQHFISALDIDMKNGDFLVQNKSKMLEEGQQNSNTAQALRIVYSEWVNRAQRIAFLKLLPIYSLFICWSIVYDFLASDFMRHVRDSENRMVAVLQALNNQAVIAYEQGSFTFTNGTDIVRNRPIKDDYLERLESLVKVDHFVNSFRDENGKLTALQEKVLYDFPCEDLLPYVAKDYEGYIYTYDGCIAIAKGSGSTGLVEINSGLYTAALDVLQMFENSNKTRDELNEVFLTGLGATGDLINAAEGFYMILYSATFESFDDNVDSIKKSTVYFTVFIVIGTGIVTLLTWYLVIKKIFRAQKIDWLILQLIPVKLILGNKHIQQYLLRHSDGMFDGVQGFL